MSPECASLRAYNSQRAATSELLYVCIASYNQFPTAIVRSWCSVADFSPFPWLVVLCIVVILLGGKKIPELMREFGESVNNTKGPRGGPPHPLPVTGPIETSKPKRPIEKDPSPPAPTG
jgi:TatA/E family protein of Tat protein translocase